MSEKHGAITQWLKLAGCLVVSAALIFAFFDLFSLFSVLMPLQSLLMLMVLVFTLGAANLVILFPGVLAKITGFVHAASLVLVTIVYAVVANVLSALSIGGNVIWFIVWQLLLLGLYALSLSTISFFAQRTAADTDRDKLEQTAKKTVALHLANIDAALKGRRNEEGSAALSKDFVLLKERIQASTPFGRFASNKQLLEMEQQVLGNLEYIWLQSKAEWTASAIAELRKLIEETRQLIMSREAMGIR